MRYLLAYLVIGVLAGVVVDVTQNRKSNYPPSLDMRAGMLLLFAVMGVPVLIAALVGRIWKSN